MSESAAAGAGTRIRLDLHLHTVGSWDSLSDPEEVLERARTRGLDRIAITDHNRLAVALTMAERHPDRVIAGEEVRTGEGIDLIGLYLSREIPEGTPARKACREIRAQGGIVYLPHPFAGGKGGGGRHAEALAPLVDVVEVFNARLLRSDRNRQAEELARRHGRLRGGGSDAHTVDEVGNVHVDVPDHPNEPAALLRALEDARITGRTATPWAFVRSNAAKLRKRLGPATPSP